MDFLDLIKSDGYITVSKSLAEKIGLKEALVLSELVSQYKYFKKREELDDDGYFYCTSEKMKKNTTINQRTESRVINNLIELNLIKKELKGLPAKRHFKIKEKNIKKLIINDDKPCHSQVGQNDQSRVAKIAKQESPKSPTIHNNNNNKIEEEETQNFSQQNKTNIPDNAKLKFKQVFNRELSSEFYEKLTKKYSDQKIIMKALEVAEANADKPSYLLKILSDWQDNGLTSISSINTYLEERKGKKQANKAKKETSATDATTTTSNDKRSLDELYESGYR